MFVFFRAVTYATLFIGFLLMYVPARLLSWSGMVRPTAIGPQGVAGMIVAAAGAAVALACIFTFIFVGRGTPAPFDPPRRLGVRGPYGWVRNPMYIGAGLALAGAALFYHSWPLFAYAVVFSLVTHLFVVCHEEPALRQAFGDEYEAYCKRVSRWRPRPLRS